MGDLVSQHPVVSEDDQSLVLLIVVLFLMVVSILSVLSKMAITIGMVKTVTPTEWIVASAMIFGVAQSIAVVLATKSGLGKKEELLSAIQISYVAKAMYASDYFYFLALGTCKISMLLFIRKLAASKAYRQFCFYTIYYIVAWTLAAFLTLALRCGIRMPWDTSLGVGACINTKAFWITIWFLDMVSELVIMILPIFLMKPVNIALSKKLFVISVFLARITYVIATVVRLFFLPLSMESPDFTFNNTNSTIATQIVLSVSILTACLPSLKPLLDAFNSGQMVIHVKNGTNGYYGSGSHSGSGQHYAMGRVPSKITPRSGAEVVTDDLPQSRQKKENKQQKAYHSHGGSLAASRRTTSQDLQEDSISVVSQAQSEQMIIKKDVAWTVQYEDSTVQHSH